MNVHVGTIRKSCFSDACCSVMDFFLSNAGLYFTPRTAALSMEKPAATVKDCMRLLKQNQYLSELAAGIKWLDGEAQRKGITFYDAVFEVLYQHDVNEKASEWFRGRN